MSGDSAAPARIVKYISRWLDGTILAVYNMPAEEASVRLTYTPGLWFIVTLINTPSREQKRTCMCMMTRLYGNILAVFEMPATSLVAYLSCIQICTNVIVLLNLSADFRRNKILDYWGLWPFGPGYFSDVSPSHWHITLILATFYQWYT